MLLITTCVAAALLIAAMERLYLKGLAEADVFDSELSESSSEDGSNESGDSQHSCVMVDDGAEVVMLDNARRKQRPSVASSFKETDTSQSVLPGVLGGMVLFLCHPDRARRSSRTKRHPLCTRFQSILKQKMIASACSLQLLP